jgi:uncharacterized protein involved in exopolysaccharide biosynthesis
MYTATTTLNFDFTGDPVDSQGRAVLRENTYISTQKGIIESQHVAQIVVDGLTKNENKRLIAAFDAKRSVIDDLKYLIMSPIRYMFSSAENTNKGGGASDNFSGDTDIQVSSAYSALARGIGADLLVEPMFNSRIVNISYSSTDRKVAALMANKYAEAYIATNLQMITDPARKSNTWFDEQLKSLRNRLEDAQSRLTDYQQEEGIVSSDERLDTENSRLKELSSQLVGAQQATRNAVTEKEKLQELLDSGASLTAFRPVFDNPVVQRIKAEIRDLEGTRVQHSSALGKNHPKMKKIDSELYAARIRLEAEIQSISDGISNAAELSAERERDLKKELAKQKELVLGLKNQHDRIAVLEREVESLQATYNAALTQLNTTSMQSMVEQTNVSIVDAANIPASHSSPRVLTNLVLGGFAGLLLGVGVALFREVFTRRVYSRDDLISELGIPLLGHLKKA